MSSFIVRRGGLCAFVLSMDRFDPCMQRKQVICKASNIGTAQMQLHTHEVNTCVFEWLFTCVIKPNPSS